MELVRIGVAEIAQDTSLSAAVDLLDRTLTAIQMPATWDAADLTFQAAEDLNGTYQNVYDDNDAEMTIQAAAARYIVIQPPKLAGLRFIKIRSGTSGSAVNQTTGSDPRLIILMGMQIS